MFLLLGEVGSPAAPALNRAGPAPFGVLAPGGGAPNVKAGADPPAEPGGPPKLNEGVAAPGVLAPNVKPVFAFPAVLFEPKLNDGVGAPKPLLCIAGEVVPN